MPDYTPKYDDFDHPAPTPPTEPAEPTPAVEPIQVQGAEKPRGPHKAPVHKPQATDSASDGFGAGVFE